MRFGLVQKIMWRHFYYALVDTARIVALRRFMSDLTRGLEGAALANKLRTLTFSDVRVGARNSLGMTLPDFAWTLAS